MPASCRSRGMVARSSSIASPFVNLAGRLRLGPDPSAALDALCTHFASRNAPFGVMLGPRATPSDLPARLAQRGLGHAQRCEGLVLTDLTLNVPQAGSCVIRRIDAAQRTEFDRVKAESFEMPLAVARAIGDLLFGPAGVNAVLHLAYLDGRAVGFSQTFHHGAVAILGGAGVIPAARGRGVFRALLASRFELARRHALRAATIQAYDHTSAPILKRLGFASRGDLYLWTWQPRSER
jgi:GNAT superfamily N-acetyltransferase